MALFNSFLFFISLFYFNNRWIQPRRVLGRGIPGNAVPDGER